MCTITRVRALTCSLLSSSSFQSDPSGVGSDRGAESARRGCLACRDPLERVAVCGTATELLSNAVGFFSAVGWRGSGDGQCSNWSLSNCAACSTIRWLRSSVANPAMPRHTPPKPEWIMSTREASATSLDASHASIFQTRCVQDVYA